MHGRSKFVAKKLEEKDVKEKRSIEMLVMQAERAWARAMERKEDDDNKRAKFHSVRRLRKAVTWAEQLVKVCETRADNRTQLEAEAYLAWMRGNELFERENWAAAQAPLLQAKTIYEKLAQAVTSDQTEFYTVRVDELTTLYRYALSKSDVKSSLADAETLRSMMTLATDDPALKLLQSKLGSVIEATQRQRADQTSDVTWMGRKIVLKSPALRLAFVKAAETTAEVEAIASAEKTKKKSTDTSTAAVSAATGEDQAAQKTSRKAESLGHKLAAYDRLFQVWGATKLKIRDERSAALQLDNNTSILAELELLMNYALYTEQSQMIVRNLLLVSSIEKKIDSVGFDNLANVKPDEVVRMYESTLQLLAETDQTRLSAQQQQQQQSSASSASLGSLDMSEVKAAKALSEGREFGFKAIRCYYLALSYAQVEKWSEAVALLGRAKDQAELAPRLIASSDPKLNKRLAHLLLQINSALIWLQAKAALANSAESETLKSAAAADAAGQQTGAQSGLHVLSNLKSWDASYATERLIDFPPATQAFAAKPVLFDLAFSGFEAPDLSAKSKAPKSGFFSSFWGR